MLESNDTRNGFGTRSAAVQIARPRFRLTVAIAVFSVGFLVGCDRQGNAAPSTRSGQADSARAASDRTPVNDRTAPARIAQKAKLGFLLMHVNELVPDGSFISVIPAKPASTRPIDLIGIDTSIPLDKKGNARLQLPAGDYFFPNPNLHNGKGTWLLDRVDGKNFYTEKVQITSGNTTTIDLKISDLEKNGVKKS